MQRLYNFWVSFLPDGFNEPMYASFKRYAEEDAATTGHTYGLSCLFQFYQQYLAAEFDAGACESWSKGRCCQRCDCPHKHSP
jgi:hypothetical protein